MLDRVIAHDDGFAFGSNGSHRFTPITRLRRYRDEAVPRSQGGIVRQIPRQAAALRQSPSNFRQSPSNFRQILRGPSVKFRQIRQIRQIPDPARALRQIPDPARAPGLMHARSLSNFT